MTIQEFNNLMQDAGEPDKADMDRTEENGLQDQSLRRIAGKAARLGGWAIDLEQNQLYWSDEVCAIHDLPAGYQPSLEEGLGYFTEDVRGIVMQHMQACTESGTPYDLELPKYTAKGRLIWVRSIGEAVRDNEGRIVALQGAFQDISSRKHAELQIRQQATMLDHASDAIIATDPDCRITYWNQAAEALYGWLAKEVVGKILYELLQVDAGQITDQKRALLDTGLWKGDITKTTRDGRRLNIQTSWSLIRDEQGKPASIFTIDNDVTELRREEENLRQSQKLEAVGTLASGIAHDFNNLLMVINSYSERLQEAESLTLEERQALAVISRAGERAVTLTSQLLGFSQKSMQHIQAMDLNALVAETATHLEVQHGSHIRITTALADDLRTVYLDREQMQQILLNLTGNACLAMPDGGSLVLETENLALHATELPQALKAKPGPYVRLNIRDSGCGMTPELLDRIFEPFFTTRDVGKGSGLGLSMAMGVMQQSGGWIEVSSVPGKGSCFRVYCPAR